MRRMAMKGQVVGLAVICALSVRSRWRRQRCVRGGRRRGCR